MQHYLPELPLSDVVRIDDSAALMGRSVTELLREADAGKRMLYVALTPHSSTLIAIPSHKSPRSDSYQTKAPKFVALASEYAASLVISGFANVEKWQASFDGGVLDWHCWRLDLPQCVTVDQIFVPQTDVDLQIQINAHAALVSSKVSPATAKTQATPNCTVAQAPAIEGTMTGAANPVPYEKESGPGFPKKKAAMIAQYKNEWPTIERDIKDAKRNGLSVAAKAGARDWHEVEAKEWARNKGKLNSTDKSVEMLTGTMNKIANSPISHSHRLIG
jgi:hypothetical protein